jgi:hypothetical protein
MRVTYWIFQLYLWSTVFAPAAAQEERSELLTQIAGKGSELAIEFHATDNTTYRGAFASGTGPPILKLERRDWAGLDRLHYGWRTLENTSDETTLSVQLEAFEYSDGSWAGAIAVLNDSLRHPVGTLEGDLVMILGPRVIYSRRSVILHDQCGFAVQFGEVRWVPNRAAAGYFLDHYPTDVDVPPRTGRTRRYGWKVDTLDYPNTHQVGSPRNQQYPEALADVLFYTRDRRPPNLLYRFVLNQIGIWFRSDDVDRQAHGRPYHLADHRERNFLDNIFRAGVRYGIDAPDRWVDLNEGKPRVKFYLDTFGRGELPAELRKNPPAGGWHVNGYDAEHHELSRLVVAHWLLGSELAKREAELILECGMAGRGHGPEPDLAYSKAIWHSDRTWGWKVLSYVWAWRLTGYDDVLHAARTALDLLEGHEFEERLGRGSDTWDVDYFVGTTSSGNAQWPGSATSSTWRTAPIGYACGFMKDLDPDEDWRRRWAEQWIRVSEQYLRGWVPGEGVLEHFYLRTQPTVEDSHEHNGLAWNSPRAKWTGVSRWNASNLARAAIETGREDFRTMALEYKAVAESERSGGSVPGGGSWASGDFWLWMLE